MKIGVFTPKFIDNIEQTIRGGAEEVAYNLAVNLIKRGHEVFMFTVSDNFNTSIRKFNNLNVFEYKYNLKIFSRPVSISLEYDPLFYDLDVVHIHTGGQLPLVVSTLFKIIRKKPVIVTYHGDFYIKGNTIMKNLIKLYNKFQELLLGIADLIISPSEYYIKQSKILNKYKYKTVVVSNGLNLSKYKISYSKIECRRKLGISTHSKVVLFLSAIREKKKPDLLIKAMQKVVREVPNACLIMAGKGRMEGKIKQLVKELGIEDLVLFPGFVKESEKPLYFKAADVFVLPSQDEIFGIACLEAMACGTPVIASMVGGIPEIIENEKTGLLVPPNNPEALADAIIYLLKNRNIRRKLSKHAFKRIKNFSWEKITNETERIYKKLIG